MGVREEDAFQAREGPRVKSEGALPFEAKDLGAKIRVREEEGVIPLDQDCGMAYVSYRNH